MFKRLTIFLVLGLAGISGCAPESDPWDPAMQRYTLQHDGLVREYFVFLPSTYDGETEHPVAIFLHGYGGTATGTEAEVTQGLNQYAEEYGFVMVYPQGTWFMASVDDAEPWEAKELIKRHIFSLRKKIEPEPSSPRYILNVRGIGYRLAA